MKPLRERSVHRVGLAGGVVLVVLSLLLAYVSTAAFGKRHYTAYLAHTAGLRVGESVQVAGVTVGKVSGVQLRGRQVEVDFTADKDIRMGDRTTAAVKVLTLLGTHYLAVTPRGTGTMRDGAIPLSRTSVPYNLQDVIEGAQGTLDALDSARISESLTVMADALRGTPAAARRALEGVSELSQVAADRADQMRVLLRSTRTVTGKLADNRSAVIDLMKRSNLILTELVDRRDAIRTMLIDARRLATAVSALIDDNDAELSALMKNLSSTLELLRNHDAGLNASIQGLATTSRYFANATGNGPWLDLHLPVLFPDNLSCINPNGGCK